MIVSSLLKRQMSNIDMQRKKEPIPGSKKVSRSDVEFEDSDGEPNGAATGEKREVLARVSRCSYH